MRISIKAATHILGGATLCILAASCTQTVGPEEDLASPVNVEVEDDGLLPARGGVRCNNEFVCRTIGGETVGVKATKFDGSIGAKVRVFERPNRREDVRVQLSTHYFSDGKYVCCAYKEESSGDKQIDYAKADYDYLWSFNGTEWGWKIVRLNAVQAFVQVSNDGAYGEWRDNAGTVAGEYGQCQAANFCRGW